MTTPMFCSFFVDKLTQRATITLATEPYSGPWLRGLGHRVSFSSLPSLGRARYDVPYGQRLLIIAAAVDRFTLVRVHVLDREPEPLPPPRVDCTEACHDSWRAQCTCRCGGRWHARLRWRRIHIQEHALGSVTSYEVDRWKGRRVLKRVAT
jgi:hypothetical protein